MRIAGAEVSLAVSALGLASNRAKRELMVRVPPVRELTGRRHAQRLLHHRPQLPDLDSDDRELVSRRGSEGAVLTSLDELGLPKTDSLRRGLMALAAILAARARDKHRNTIRPSQEELLADTQVWQWGLQERLLDPVENHIGLPVRYRGADVRCEVANGDRSGVRQWHRDAEDRRQFKMLVWLVDVYVDGGPFEHISRSHAADVVRSLRYTSGYVCEGKVAQTVPEREWHPCTGPTWTAVIADTASVFHRLKPPTARNWYSVTFSWTSRRPVKFHPINRPPQSSVPASLRISALANGAAFHRSVHPVDRQGIPAEMSNGRGVQDDLRPGSKVHGQTIDRRQVVRSDCAGAGIARSMPRLNFDTVHSLQEATP